MAQAVPVRLRPSAPYSKLLFYNGYIVTVQMASEMGQIKAENVSLQV